jgi:ferrous iron transport protein A
MKNLSHLKTGQSGFVVFVKGGQSVNHRLAELGLLAGEKVTMVHHSQHGPITVRVKGSKISIGHGLADKIMLKE